MDSSKYIGKSFFILTSILKKKNQMVSLKYAKLIIIDKSELNTDDSSVFKALSDSSSEASHFFPGKSQSRCTFETSVECFSFTFFQSRYNSNLSVCTSRHFIPDSIIRSI